MFDGSFYNNEFHFNFQRNGLIRSNIPQKYFEAVFEVFIIILFYKFISY